MEIIAMFRLGHIPNIVHILNMASYSCCCPGWNGVKREVDKFLYNVIIYIMLLMHLNFEGHLYLEEMDKC
jgi:hypothetical protein